VGTGSQEDGAAPRAVDRVMSRLGKALALFSAVVLWAAALGFVLFSANVMRTPVSAAGKADAIVVLTGGQSRIKEGARLLKDGYGARLLISGVNPRTSEADLIRISGLDTKTFDCCVDLGYTALNTIGNASETQTWAKAKNYRSLIVVTSNYHMPRTMVELSRTLPDLRLIPHTVTPEMFDTEAWWLSPVTMRNLVAEYVKFLPSAVRFALHRAVTPFENGSVANAPALHDRKT
jgi:uncharacterized SAM-binding protein YcdF (DUF218 family)